MGADITLGKEDIGLVEEKYASPLVSQSEVIFHVSLHFFRAVSDVAACNRVQRLLRVRRNALRRGRLANPWHSVQ